MILIEKRHLNISANGEGGRGVSKSGWFWGLGLAADRAERDLGGIEELGALLAHDYVEEHGMGGASDEIADIFIAGERGHDIAVGFVGVDGGNCLVFATCQFLPVDALPNLQAAGDGRICGGRAGFVLRDWDGYELCGCSHVGVSPFEPLFFIVRGVRVIICKSCDGADGVFGHSGRDGALQPLDGNEVRAKL